MHTPTRPHSGSRVKKIAISISALLCVFVIMLFVAFRLNPWPHVLLVRRAFTRDVFKSNQVLEKHIPTAAASAFHNLHACLDHYFPVVLVPIKAFTPIKVSGNTVRTDNYSKISASMGYMPLVLSLPEMSTALLAQPWKPMH